MDDPTRWRENDASNGNAPSRGPDPKRGPHFWFSVCSFKDAKAWPRKAIR